MYHVSSTLGDTAVSRIIYNIQCIINSFSCGYESGFFDGFSARKKKLGYAIRSDLPDSDAKISIRSGFFLMGMMLCGSGPPQTGSLGGGGLDRIGLIIFTT